MTDGTSAGMNWDRVERLLGTDNLERLASARVGVVGLGSGGGYVALSLAMSGVGHFILIDDDVLEETNMVRHVADRRYLGWNKAAAVADLLRHRNPNLRIDVHEGRIEQHLDLLDDLDLLVVGVDGEQAKYTINEACLERGLTAIYAGVYERGEGGDVVAIRPGSGPCYACWAAELREGLFEPQFSEMLDYGVVAVDGTLKGEPGLWVHVAKVAAIQTDFALNELLAGAVLAGAAIRPSYPANTIIIANTALEILDGEMTPPHTALWVNVQRDPYCLVCGDEVNAEQAEDASELSLSDLAGAAGISIQDDEG